MKSLITGFLCLMLTSWSARHEPRLQPDRLWGVAGSLWGAFVAELMRPGLHRLWHVGREQHAPQFSRISLHTKKNGQGSSLSQAALHSNLSSPPSPGLLRHSLSLAKSRLQMALLLSPSDWVLLEIALEGAKAELKADSKGTWSKMMTLAEPVLRPQPDGLQSLAQSLAAATACASFCEVSMATHRSDSQAWLANLRLNLKRCEALLTEAAEREELKTLSIVRTHDLMTQISVLQRLSDSYSKR
jgi:hypothetical protein